MFMIRLSYLYYSYTWKNGLRIEVGPCVLDLKILWQLYNLEMLLYFPRFSIYHQISNIRHTLGSKKIVDHSDVVGASPVGAAPTTSSFST